MQFDVIEGSGRILMHTTQLAICIKPWASQQVHLGKTLRRKGDMGELDPDHALQVPVEYRGVIDWG